MLRNYQIDLKRRIYDAWADPETPNVCAVMPCGGGKTKTMATIARERGERGIIMAHREELVSQISAALAREGVFHRIIAPDDTVREITAQHIEDIGRNYVRGNADYAVAGVDTLIRRSDPFFDRLDHWQTDEGHHLLAANKWGRAVKMLGPIRGIGWTATPGRADRRPLRRGEGGCYDTMVLGPTMRDLIGRGFLKDFLIYGLPQRIDMSSVHVTAGGDFNQAELADAADAVKASITGDVVRTAIRLAPGRKGVTFAINVDMANEHAAGFREAGVPCAVLTAKTRDRAEIIRAYRGDGLQEVVNVDVLGEGFDLPGIVRASFARPTASFPLYCLDPDTEVLTDDGWFRAEKALNLKTVKAFDLSNSSIKTVEITGSVKRSLHANEMMYSVSSPHLDIMVSDGHDMIVKSATGTSKNWQKQQARAVSTRSRMFRVPVSGLGDFSGTGLSQPEIDFIGWYLTDGGMNKKTHGITISQSIKKLKHIEHIRNTIIACGFKFREYVWERKNVPITHNDIVRFDISKGKPRSTDKHLEGWIRLEKWLDKSIPDCFNNMTREEFGRLLQTINLGDGSNQHVYKDGHTKRSLTITCGDNETMADRLQEMCIVRGFRCNKATAQYSDRGKWFILHIKDKMTSTIAGRNTPNGMISNKKRYARSRFTLSNYKPEYVWCLTNSLGTLITRRNGKVSIVGNCQQFGRPLRPLAGEPTGIICDHVGNVVRHRGAPDGDIPWSLDGNRRESTGDDIPVRVCTNPDCSKIFQAYTVTCPYCGFKPSPTSAERQRPDILEGDLTLYDPALLAHLRGEVARIKGAPEIPFGASPMVARSIERRWSERAAICAALEGEIDLWAGYWHIVRREPLDAVYRRFYLTFGMDTQAALAQPGPKQQAMHARVAEHWRTGR